MTQRIDESAGCPLVIVATFGFAGAIVVKASLSFLCLGDALRDLLDLRLRGVVW